MASFKITDIPSISTTNLKKLQNGYLNSFMIRFGDEEYDFTGVPYSEDYTDDDYPIGIISKEYINGDVTISIYIQIDLTSEKDGVYTIETIELAISSLDSLDDIETSFDWSIENYSILRENDGYLKTLDSEQSYKEVQYYVEANPSEEGWYEYDESGNDYELSTDEEIELVYSPVTPESGDNPSIEQWYEKSEDFYILTEDETVVSGKTYYEKTYKSYYAPTTYYTQEITSPEGSNFVRLDKYGIYGVKSEGTGSEFYTLKGISQIQEDAIFSLTWNGFTLKTKNPNEDAYGKIIISDIGDIQVFDSINQNQPNTIIGYLDEDLLPSPASDDFSYKVLKDIKNQYGLYSKNLYIGDKDNFLAFYYSSDGNYYLTLKSEAIYFSTDSEQSDKTVKEVINELTSITDQTYNFYKSGSDWINYGTDSQSKAYLQIGDLSSGISLKLTSDKLSFIQSINSSDTEVAYMSNEELYISESTITEKLNFGNWALIPRNNGENLAIKYIGEEDEN